MAGPLVSLPKVAERIQASGNRPAVLLLGVFAGVWITADMTVGHLLLASTFTAYSLIALRIKDRELSRLLGDTYTSYCARVPMFGPHWLTATFVAVWLLLSGAEIANSLPQQRYDQLARDDLRQLQQALIANKAKTGDDVPRHLIGACERAEYKPLYDGMMGRLTSSTGALAKPIAHPARPSKGLGYCYSEMMLNDKRVRVVWTQLPSSGASNTGEADTCRSSGQTDFCSRVHANRDYCLCVP